MKSFRQPALIAALLLQLLPVFADDVITNVMSPIVSYQYSEDFSSEALTNGGVISPLASYQYLEDFSSAALTNGGIMSPIVSYQYYEWPGNGILNLQSSPVVSYYYPTGGASAAVSASLSRVVVSPGSLPADGQSFATVTVGLLDGNGNPVAGKVVAISAVELASSDGVATLASIAQPANPTDNNGQATATLTSAVAGTAIISAQDVTDGISLRQPTVQFTSALVAPSPILSDAIVALGAATTNLLGQSIASIARDEGTVGDAFLAQASAEQRQEGVDAISAGLGAVLALVPGSGSFLKDAVISVAETIDSDAAESSFGQLLDYVATSSTGLSSVGQGIANTNAIFLRMVQQQEQGLLVEIPPLTTNWTTALTNDLELRLEANRILETVLSWQDARLDMLQTSSKSSTSSGLTAFLLGVDVVGDVIAAIPAVGYAGSVVVGETVDAGELILNESLDQQALDNDQKCYALAWGSLSGCSVYSGLIYSNTASAFAQISQGQQPNPVTGKILDSSTQLLGNQCNINSGAWSTDPVTTPAVATSLSTMTNAFSEVTLTNTSQQPAAFTVYALYSNSIYGSSQSLPMVSFAKTNLSVGQAARVRISYLDGSSGAMPQIGTGFIIYVLGCNDNGIFYIDSASSSVEWPDLNGTAGSPRPMDNGLTNSVIIENPIKSYVTQNLSNQTYLAQIWVANPFIIPLVATITQPLGPGITVLATDGALGGSSIAWTNAMPSNSIAEVTFTFSVSATPGASTNLPPPALIFTDLTQTNSVSLQAAAPGFNGVFPVGVSGFVPAGIAGSDVPMVVTVTNWTSTNQAGLISVVVADSGDVRVANLSLPFSLGGLADTNLAFILPGSLPPASYSVIGSLSINGGSAQVLAGLYVVPPVPITLGCASTATVTSNGFTMILQGPVGFACLIEASTNLVDWQPIQYFVVTNSPAYFTDFSATYYNQRFYRAVPLSQVQSPVVPQFGAVMVVFGGGVQVTLTGGIGQSYTVQASTNLVNWAAITNLALPTGAGQFTDYSLTNCPQRFYRAVVP
jgi:hypothetical protein